MNQVWCLLVLLVPLLCQNQERTATLNCLQHNNTITISITSNLFGYKSQDISNSTCSEVSNSSLTFPIGYKFLCQAWCCAVYINQLPVMCTFEQHIKVEMDLFKLWMKNLVNISFASQQRYSEYWCGQCNIDLAYTTAAIVASIIVAFFILVGLIILAICCCRVRIQQKLKEAERKKKKEREKANRESYNEEAPQSDANIPPQKIQIVYP